MLEVVLPEKSYEIIIQRNALDQVADWLSGLWQEKKIAIISDENVFLLYGQKTSHVPKFEHKSSISSVEFLKFCFPEMMDSRFSHCPVKSLFIPHGLNHSIDCTDGIIFILPELIVFSALVD